MTYYLGVEKSNLGVIIKRLVKLLVKDYSSLLLRLSFSGLVSNLLENEFTQTLSLLAIVGLPALV